MVRFSLPLPRRSFQESVAVLAIACSFPALSLRPLLAAATPDDKPKWDVQAPPGPKKTVRIKTDTFTWPDVDVSPDGQWVLFDVLGDLYRAPLKGGLAESLTQGIAWDYQARFSPDGQSIAFISDRDGADNIWLMDVTSKKLKQISQETFNLVHNPAFSPDGQYIAVRKSFVSTRSIPGGEIWMYHISGGEGSQVRERLHGDGTQKNIAEPAFSQDGRSIYYSLDVTAGKTWQYNKNSLEEIFAINRWDLQKGKEERVTGGSGGAIRPTPSPDGRSLAFIKRVDMQSAIYLKDLESGDEQQVFLGLDRDLQESDGSLGNAPHFAFTPDSGSLVFWAKGKIHRMDILSKQLQTLPIRLETTRTLTELSKIKVNPAEDTLKVKMPRWIQKSPDGKFLVYQALGYLYRKDLSSGLITRLSSQNEDFEFYPSFSRDGKQLVYTSWNDQTGGQIKIFDTATGKSRVVSKIPGHYVEPQFSPSGQALVYRKFPEGMLLSRKWSENPGIYHQKLDGSSAVKISEEGGFPHFGMSEDRIFFVRGLDPTGVELVSTDLRGEAVRVHAKGDDVTQFLVSPDGKWLAFTEQFKVHMTPFVQTGKVIGVQKDSKLASVYTVSQKAGEFLGWTGDSRSIFWTQGPQLASAAINNVIQAADRGEKALKSLEPEAFALNHTIPADKPSGTIALVGANIITMRDADKTREIIEDGVVVVKGNRIEAVGPRAGVKIPEGAMVQDVKGKTIIPGLIDAHAHGPQGTEEITPQQNWKNYSSLAFGVTTVHDPSNDSSEIFAAAELQRAGLTVAPRIFSTGTILYGAYGAGAQSKIESYEDALFHVQRLKDVGAISIKSYQQPRRSQRQMLVAAGRELGIKVMPEGGSKFQFNMGMIADGHIGIEHAIPLQDAYDDVLQFWSASGTGYTPTFVVAYGGLGGERYWYDRTEVWKDEQLMRFVPKFAVEPVSVRRETAPDHHYNHFAVARLAKKLRDLGVRIHIGAHGQREGLAAHWELWMMEQGGMSAWETLRAGTIDGAIYLGMEESLGSIEPGKLADLVVIDGNPLKNLRSSEFVAFTMLNGRLFDAKSMNEVGLRPKARKPFYFEQNPSASPHPVAHEMYQRKAEILHWVH